MSDLVWGDTVSRAEFEHALRLGLGRAVLWLRAHPSSDFRDLILHACTHNLAYDRQWEGSREDYLFDLVQASGEPDWYYEQLAPIVTGPRDEEIYYDQVLEMMRLWAQHGHPTARQTLHDGFLAAVAADCSGDEAIIKLDGADGLIFVAEHMGWNPPGPDDTWYDERVFDYAKDAGLSEPLELLRVASLERPGIAAFLARLESYQAQKKRPNRPRLDPASVPYAEFKELPSRDSALRFVSPTTWGEKASEADILLAAADLAVETDRTKLLRLLRMFWRRPYPLNPAPLLALAVGSERTIAIRAFTTLEALAPHPDVRALALRVVAGNDETAARGVGLLEHQFQTGDHSLIEALASRVTDKDAWHLFNVRTRDFYEAHPDAASEPRMLLTLYEHNPCVMCRESIVARLIKLNALPDWMAAECRLDAGPEMRKLMAAYDNPPAPTEVAPHV